MLATPIRDEHISQLLVAAAGTRNSHRDTALIRFAAETGARPVELASLTWRSFVDAGGALTGRCRWQTAKRGGVRDIALSDPTRLDIGKLYARSAKRLDDPVFVTERRKAFQPQSMRYHLKSLAAKAGLNASAYSLRHNAFGNEAKSVLYNGGTGANLLNFTGHKSLSSVQHYLDAHNEVNAQCEIERTTRASAW